MSVDVRRIARMPEPGERWMHYKGDLYDIVGIGHDTRSGNAVVIYQAIGWGPDAKLWVRDLGEFLGFNDNHQKRFTLLGAADTASACDAVGLAEYLAKFLVRRRPKSPEAN